MGEPVRVTPPKFAIGSRVKHVKTGNFYRIIYTPDEARIESGAVPAYIYSDTVCLWVRPQSEMEDGRFVAVP